MGIATLDLSPELFIEFCKACKAGSPRRFIVKENPLPDDAEIVRAAYVDTGFLPPFFCLYISSAEFADVSSDDRAPKLPPVVFETIYDPPECYECGTTDNVEKCSECGSNHCDGCLCRYEYQKT